MLFDASGNRVSAEEVISTVTPGFSLVRDLSYTRRPVYLVQDREGACSVLKASARGSRVDDYVNTYAAHITAEFEALQRVNGACGLPVPQSFHASAGQVSLLRSYTTGTDLYRATAFGVVTDDQRAELGRTVGHLHSLGIAYLEIEPRNIVIEEGTGRLIPIDLGTALLSDRVAEGVFDRAVRRDLADISRLPSPAMVDAVYSRKAA